MNALIIISTRKNLLAGWTQDESMLKLCCVAALDITQRWIGVDDANIAQVFQSHEVLALAQTIQPTSTECQGAKVLVDHIQKLFRLDQPVTQR